MTARVSATPGYRDAARAMEFLVAALGFENWRFGTPLPELVQDASGHWKPAHE